MATDLAEKTTAAPPAPGSGAIQLSGKALRLEEFGRRTFFVKAPPGSTQEDPLHPEFWAKVSRELSRHDIVRLLADDESWEMEVIIETVRQGGADVSVWKVGKRTAIARAETWLGNDHHTQYRSGEGWCVIRAKDGSPIIRGHSLEVSAINQFHREQPRVVQ